MEDDVTPMVRETFRNSSISNYSGVSWTQICRTLVSISAITFLSVKGIVSGTYGLIAIVSIAIPSSTKELIDFVLTIRGKKT